MRQKLKPRSTLRRAIISAMRTSKRAVDAGADLVEQDDARIAHQGAAEFEQLLLAAGERAGLGVAELVEFEEFERFAGAVIDLFLLAAIVAVAEGGVEDIVALLAIAGDHQIFDDGEAGEFLRDLERAGEAHMAALMHGKPGDVAAFEQDAAGARHEPAGDHVEERRLAGAIGADEAGDAAAVDFEAHIIDGDEPAETHRHAIEGDHLLCVPRPWGARAGPVASSDGRVRGIKCRTSILRNLNAPHPDPLPTGERG